MSVSDDHGDDVGGDEPDEEEILRGRPESPDQEPDGKKRQQNG